MHGTGPGGDVVLEFLRSPLSFLDRIVRQHGGSVGLRLGGEHVVLLTDPALSRQVLIDQADTFCKEGTAFFPGSSLAGNGLLVSDGPLWRRQRQLSNPAFRRTAIESYAQAMGSATRQMLATSWSGSGRRDVYSDFNALTLQITTEALFGKNLSAEQGAKVTGAIQTAFEFFAGRASTGFIIPEWFPTPDNFLYHEAMASLDSAVYGIIDSRQGELAGSAQSPQCLLDNLLMSEDEFGRGMSREALRDELMTLLVAGQETSAILLAWTCAYLAHHPEVQARAAEEVGQVQLPQVLEGAEPSPANVQEMRYLQAVVLETLRLRPPAYIVGRCAAIDVTLGSHQLPKVCAGTTLLVSPWVMHRDPQHWPQPETFQPERWLDLLAAKPAMAELSNMGSNGVYLPFGAGPRNCIGTGFAMMEALVVLASMLRKVRFLTVPGERFPAADPRITLRPASCTLLLEMHPRIQYQAAPQVELMGSRTEITMTNDC
ncbi:cytochrome P450 [Coccomyxa subellipsoidea C-169]|uniref:Cytochrome P450 n=1 Tax=Coccomyxa subellipsoidea (strain C-169) TaxID=574566 RepID=I0YPB7_COCSC|nr:cytochrome P450 [Coccomyxa subellipsoidea C-169]EIE20236.1 cytochrome P450 [Coccomyxa subellipsoidea C-169]|eukprot:XP_005644780.1 cytochrome P450 [Coccomyxa subellipsoidea C-169]